VDIISDEVILMRKRLGKIAAIFIASMFMVSNLSLPVSAAARADGQARDSGEKTSGEAGEFYTDTGTSSETESADKGEEAPEQEKKKGRLSDFVALLNGAEGYDFIGFSVDKGQLLGMLDAAKTKTEAKLAEASDDKKEELQNKLSALTSMIETVSGDENEAFYLTDDAGNLMEDGPLYQSLKLMVGGVSKVDVGADWEKIVKEIFVVNGESSAKLYFKGGAYYADIAATKKIETIADLDAYIAENGDSGVIMADNSQGHFGGLFFVQVVSDTSEDGTETGGTSRVRILFADHEGNIVYDPASSDYKIEDMVSAYAINNHIVTIIDGESQGILFTDGKALYVDQELINPVTDIASVGENFANDSDEGHIGGYTLADSDGVLFADHEGNVVLSSDYTINDDVAVNSLRNRYLVIRDGDNEVRLYADGEHLYKDPERRQEVTGAGDVDGDLLADNGGHLSAYYLVDESGQPLLDEDGKKAAFISADGSFAEGTVFDKDMEAVSKRYHEVHMYAGEDGSAEAIVYYSDGELFTDTELESAFTGADTVTEDGTDYSGLFADLGDKHFGGFFLADGGEFRTSGGSKQMFAAANGQVTGDTSIDADTEVKALYFRHASVLRSEMYDSYGLLNENYDDLDEDEQEEYELLARMVEEEDRGVGLYSDGNKLYEDAELTEEADEINLPYPDDQDLIRNWYAYDTMVDQNGEVWDNVVMSFMPVMSQRIAEDEEAEEGEDRFYIENYLAGYIAYNLDDEAIFVVDEDGKIDYSRTDIETEEVDQDELDKLNEMAEDEEFEGDLEDALGGINDDFEGDTGSSDEGNSEASEGSENGSGDGSGNSEGGSGDGSGSGSGDASGEGSGDASGEGAGDNSGEGSDSGSGDESGSGSDEGSGGSDEGAGEDAGEDSGSGDESGSDSDGSDEGSGDAAPSEESFGSDEDSDDHSSDDDGSDAGSPASMDAAMPDNSKQDGEE
jgi:hypothetical protein